MIADDVSDCARLRRQHRQLLVRSERLRRQSGELTRQSRFLVGVCRWELRGMTCPELWTLYYDGVLPQFLEPLAAASPTQDAGIPAAPGSGAPLSASRASATA